MKHSFVLLSTLFVLLLTSLVSCKNDDDDTTPNTKEFDQALATQFLQNYGDIVYSSYEDTYTTAQALDAAIKTFVQNPSASNLEKAKQAWLVAREPYGQTESYRFYGSPIDGDEGVEGFINAWPLDESYIDYVEGNATTGIINNPTEYPVINRQTLLDANEKDGETNVSTGYHAIEFLLWGQDLVIGGNGGNRPFTDYTTAQHADRRKEYLVVVSELLLEHLAYVMNEWTPNNSDNYRGQLESSSNPKARFQEVLVGLASLSKGELAGERIFVALDEQDRENEHSCFSDNTHRDVVANAMAIQNVYLGSYKRVDGTTVSGVSVKEIFEKADAAKTTTLTDKIAEGIAAANAIQPPFEAEIESADGRARLEKCISIYREQADLMLEIASLYGINITLE